MPDAGRVIAGTARSIRLDAPGPGTRPLADRVKQTLFGDPRTAICPEPASSTCSRAVARPASRRCRAVRRMPRSLSATSARSRTIRTNLARTALGDDGRATIVRADVLTWLRDPDRTAGALYDLVLIDPPYDDIESMSTALEAASAIVSRGGRVVAKHFWRTPPPPMVGLLASERERRFGDTALTFYRPTEDA